MSRLAVVTICLVWLTALPAGAAADDFNPRRTPVVKIVERVQDATVNIHSERTVKKPGSEELFVMAPIQNRVNGMGTGIIIDPRGYIITNHHVVEDVTLIRVRLSDGSNHTARVVVRDSRADLALLKINAGKQLPVMPLGTSKDIMVGETVVAIGNAYGYHHTVTTGIVSAVKRDVNLNKRVSYRALIQTDASINPGNSGGPLLNIHGDLIGVNVAIRAGAQGIAFAIPVDTMLRVAASMMSIKRRNGLHHGLIYRDRVHLDKDKPARDLVVDRTTGPARKANFKPGDVILKVDDQDISCGLELERALLDRPAGEKLAVTVRRQEKEHELELILKQDGPDRLSVHDVVWEKIGLRLTPAETDAVTETNQHLHGGLAVQDVNSEGAAGKAGIRRGDILVGLHQWEMVSMDNVLFVLTHPDLASFNPLRFYIVRSGQVHRGWLQQVE